MKEIELKVMNVDEKKIEQQFIKFGAKKIADESIIEKYYDFDDDRITKSKGMFRLRKAGEKIEFAYKQRKNVKDFLVFDEFETEVNDFEIVDKIIEKLGFKTIIERRKNRKTFVFKKLKIEIHKYPNIPAFFELEGISEEINKFLGKLGYQMSQTTSMTDTEIISSYKK